MRTLNRIYFVSVSLEQPQTLLELVVMFSVSANQSQVTAHIRQGVDNILAGAA